MFVLLEDQGLPDEVLRNKNKKWTKKVNDIHVAYITDYLSTIHCSRQVELAGRPMLQRILICKRPGKITFP